MTFANVAAYFSGLEQDARSLYARGYPADAQEKLTEYEGFYNRCFVSKLPLRIRNLQRRVDRSLKSKLKR